MSDHHPRSRLFALFALAFLLPWGARPAQSATRFQDGLWSKMDSTASAPGARREYAAIYDDANQRYLIFGGFYGTADGHVYVLLNELWTLSLGATPAWSYLSLAGDMPGPRHSPQWGYDPAQHRLLIFGGYGCHRVGDPLAYLNDVWQLSLDGTPTWTELTPSGAAPAGRLAGAAVYDPLRQRFVGFGGTRGLPVDTWELDLAGDPAWSSVPTDSTAPPGSYGMTGIFDPVRNRMVIFGGSTSDDYWGVHNDTWALDLGEDTPTWHHLAPGGTLPVARRSGTSIYDPLRDRMVIFGGWDSQSNEVSSFLNDTWSLSFSGDLQWAQLAPDGGPPAGRDVMAAAYDPVGDRMVVFGGWSGTTMLGDTWFLGWGGAGLAASMTATNQSNVGLARVQWSVQNATGPHAAVYRRTSGTPWVSIASVHTDATGHLTYEDRDVAVGTSYGYKLAVSSQRGELLGGETWVSVQAAGVEPTPTTFALEGARPNPVLDRLTVRFALPDAAPARLELFDLAGRRVTAREVGSLGPGEHAVELGRAAGIPAGIYLVRLTQAARAQTARVVVIGGAGARGRSADRERSFGGRPSRVGPHAVGARAARAA